MESHYSNFNLNKVTCKEELKTHIKLLKEGTNSNRKMLEFCNNKNYQNGKYPIHIAMNFNDFELLKEMIIFPEKDFKKLDNKSWTPIFYCKDPGLLLDIIKGYPEQRELIFNYHQYIPFLIETHNYEFLKILLDNDVFHPDKTIFTCRIFHLTAPTVPTVSVPSENSDSIEIENLGAQINNLIETENFSSSYHQVKTLKLNLLNFSIAYSFNKKISRLLYKRCTDLGIVKKEGLTEFLGYSLVIPSFYSIVKKVISLNNEKKYFYKFHDPQVSLENLISACVTLGYNKKKLGKFKYKLPLRILIQKKIDNKKKFYYKDSLNSYTLYGESIKDINPFFLYKKDNYIYDIREPLKGICPYTKNNLDPKPFKTKLNICKKLIHNVHIDLNNFFDKQNLPIHPQRNYYRINDILNKLTDRLPFVDFYFNLYNTNFLIGVMCDLKEQQLVTKYDISYMIVLPEEERIDFFLSVIYKIIKSKEIGHWFISESFQKNYI